MRSRRFPHDKLRFQHGLHRFRVGVFPAFLDPLEQKLRGGGAELIHGLTHRGDLGGHERRPVGVVEHDERDVPGNAHALFLYNVERAGRHVDVRRIEAVDAFIFHELRGALPPRFVAEIAESDEHRVVFQPSPFECVPVPREPLDPRQAVVGPGYEPAPPVVARLGEFDGLYGLINAAGGNRPQATSS